MIHSLHRHQLNGRMGELVKIYISHFVRGNLTIQTDESNQLTDCSGWVPSLIVGPVLSNDKVPRVERSLSNTNMRSRSNQ